MKELSPLVKDEYYPLITKNPRYRDAVRGIIMNEKEEIALIHIKGVDDFGDRDHFELPGGGIEEGESEINTLYREMIEEIGYEVKNPIEVGIIANEYHLLKRVDVQHFYLAYTKQYVGQKLLDYEKTLFKEIVFVPAKEILDFYDNYPVQNVGIEIHKRDRIAITEALRIHEKNKK